MKETPKTEKRKGTPNKDDERERKHKHKAKGDSSGNKPTRSSGRKK